MRPRDSKGKDSPSIAPLPASHWRISIPSSTWTRWARLSMRRVSRRAHRGTETVTYMIDGTFQHQDSIGGGGLIANGSTQWMTAGSGILHIERPPEQLIASGGLFHGFQLWVNLPAAQKWVPARYQDIRASNVALLTSYDGGALLRVIAGEVAGHRGPGVTYTPISLAHVTVSPGARLVLPWPRDFNALIYV